MISLVGPLTIQCWQCGQQLSVPVAEHATAQFDENGNLKAELHLDHLFLAAHFATHTEPG